MRSCKDIYSNYTQSLSKIEGQTSNESAWKLAPPYTLNVLIRPAIIMSFALLALLLNAYWQRSPAKLAWWRGLVKRRHAVILRSIFRSIYKKLKDVPIVGWVWGLWPLGFPCGISGAHHDL